MDKSPERAHTRTHTQPLTYHMLMSENKTVHASVRLHQHAAGPACACVAFVHMCACVCACVRGCVNLWALGFSWADVSNQSLSRGSLSLYPLSSEPWVDRPGPVHSPVIWCWVVLLMIRMLRHWLGRPTVKGPCEPRACC